MNEVENYELESGNVFMFFSNFFLLLLFINSLVFFFCYLFICELLFINNLSFFFFLLLELAPKPTVGTDSIMDLFER